MNQATQPSSGAKDSFTYADVVATDGSPDKKDNANTMAVEKSDEIPDLERKGVFEYEETPVVVDDASPLPPIN